jgi:23S rRNA (cytosine1962-C5)-methyltransferase
VVVDGTSERWLRRGFPWVYEAEVVSRPATVAPGEVVALVARDGTALGAGLWAETGKVAVRVFRHDPGPVDALLLANRVAAARRRRVLPPETTAWRWVHGENDGLPGIRLDVWGEHRMVTLDDGSLRGLVDPILDAAGEAASAWLCWRGEEGGDVRPPERVRGQGGDADVLVLERGRRFLVRPSAGADAGLFCDMREVRAWLEPHWAGRRVLNTFAFTGAFTVAAAAQGAVRVVSVDLSGPHLERARQNLLANGVDPERHPLVRDDVFRALDQLRRGGERFDVVVADPPAVARGRSGAWSGARDRPRLVAACSRVLEPGGWLVVSCNQGAVSPREFTDLLGQGARKAGCWLRVLHQGSWPADYPAALHFPESRYLKCYVLEVS